MSCIHSNILRPCVGLDMRDPKLRHRRACPSLSWSSFSRPSCLFVSASGKSQPYHEFPRLVHNLSQKRRLYQASVLGAERNSEGGHEMHEPGKKQSVEDLLREQIQKQEFYKGGDDKKPPRGGGGRGGPGGSDNWDFAKFMDEFLQVILATTGFVFLYICIVRGEELSKLSVDFIRYLLGAQSSPRLRRAFHQWENFWQSITWKKPEIERNEGEVKAWVE